MKHWTRVLTSMAAGLLLLAAGGLGPAGRVATSKAAGTSAGDTSTQTLRALACPSLTTCYAVGDQGTILATHDAGATWQSQSSGTQDQVFRIACPAAGVCFAPTSPGGPFDLQNPVCAGPTGQISLLRTTDSGNTWRRNAFPLQCLGPGPSCPRATTCYAFWNCSTPTACSLPGSEPGNPELYRTTDGGNRWEDRGRTPDNRTRGNSTVGIGVQSLACSTPTVCYAGGLDQVAGSTDGGSQWTRRFIYVPPCPTAEIYCHQLNLMACPGQHICYAGGTSVWGSVNPHANQNVTAVIVATRNGFRTWRRSVIKQFHGLVALSCPTSTHCFALGGGYGPFSDSIGSINETGRFAATTDGGRTWRVGRIAPYPFTALACPSVSMCYAAGYLGRLMESTDDGMTWRDLIRALFVSGTYGAKQPLHTYSPWFTAIEPWKVTVDVVLAGRPHEHGNPLGCLSTPSAKPDVYVRNSQGQSVAGPVEVNVSPQTGDYRGTSTIQVTGKLRLDAVSHCSSFSVRIDGVQTIGG